MTTENSRADALTKDQCEALQHAIDAAEEDCAYTTATHLRTILAASPVEQPAAAPHDEPACRACDTGMCSVHGPEQRMAGVKLAPAPADERAAFEECIREHSDPDRFDDRIARQDGHYVEYATALAWAAWQARAASASETGAEGATERDLSRTIEERDRMEEDGTRLAEAVGEFLGVDVGEWSSANNPIVSAIEALESRSPAMAVEAVDWRELTRRLYVELFYCDQQMTGGRRPKWTQGAEVRDALRDAKAALEAAPQPAQADVRVGLTAGERNAIERAISEVELCCQFSLANELRDLLAARPGTGD